MDTREYTPEALIDAIDNFRPLLHRIGLEDYVLDICREISVRTLQCYAVGRKDLQITDIEAMADIKGFSEWSVNVSCINLTFSSRDQGMPYNALTNRDPVVKRGFYWLTGVEPYDKVLNQLTKRYYPYAGVLTRYIWEVFNYNRIAVALPGNYRKWWNKGREIKEEDVPETSQRLMYKGMEQI